MMEQKIVYDIRKILEEWSGKKLFLVHGRSFDTLSVPAGEPDGNAAENGREVSLAALFAPLRTVHFTAFTPNPKYEEVAAGVEAFRASGADVIVAVGGGSAIDVAKCIKLFCKMDDSVNYLEQEQTDTGIPLIAVPTTAGTGSESTRHAVIYFKGKKQSISHGSIVPDTAVLEPAFLRNLPPYQKKCALLDALSQGIESWWSVNSTEESRAYSKSAVTGILENRRAYLEENDAAAAKAVLIAANFSGRAINVTATTAPHAMSYRLSSQFHIPHGHAVALGMERVFPYTVSHAEDCVDHRGRAYLEGVFSKIQSVITPEAFRELLGELEIRSPYGTDGQAEDPGARESLIREFTESVNPLRLKNHPVRLSEETLKQFYEEILS